MKHIKLFENFNEKLYINPRGFLSGDSSSMDDVISKLVMKKINFPDYFRQLKIAVDILKIDSETFHEIRSTKKLNELLHTLESTIEFKKMNSQEKKKIRSAFITYIENVEKLENIKPEAEIYIKELTASFSKINGDKDKITEIITELLRLFEPNQKNWSGNICEYLKLSPKKIESLYKVSMGLLAGNYQQMVYSNEVEVAKIIAIKTHIRALEEIINGNFQMK